MAKDFNNPVVVEGYDEHIRKLIPGYELIHLQVHALLETYAPRHANILVVGCGTGYELQYLAEQFPDWSFTAIDPAPNMIEKSQQHIKKLGLSDRIQLVIGDTTILPSLNQTFDVAVAILVSHFVPLDKKMIFFKDISNSLSKSGFCLSYELTQIIDTHQLETMKNLALKTGLSAKQIQVMVSRMEQDFSLITVEEMKNTYLEAGFCSVETFAQVLNYYGFIGFKH